jgi:RNA polymerase sigma-70 factor, ECF subfamily
MAHLLVPAAAGSVPEEPERAFELLVREHRKPLLAYAAKLLKDRGLAEDIVQEALLRAWPHAQRLRDSSGSARGWLLTVVRNLVIDSTRRAAYREVVDADIPDAVQDDHADAVVNEVAVGELLGSLSREHRAVVVHTYLCERTAVETARVLRIPAGTVKSRQHYALRQLRKTAACGHC